MKTHNAWPVSDEGNWLNLKVQYKTMKIVQISVMLFSEYNVDAPVS
jgi:hypothetical protein